MELCSARTMHAIQTEGTTKGTCCSRLSRVCRLRDLDGKASIVSRIYFLHIFHFLRFRFSVHGLESRQNPMKHLNVCGDTFCTELLLVPCFIWFPRELWEFGIMWNFNLMQLRNFRSVVLPRFTAGYPPYSVPPSMPSMPPSMPLPYPPNPGYHPPYMSLASAERCNHLAHLGTASSAKKLTQGL